VLRKRVSDSTTKNEDDVMSEIEDDGKYNVQGKKKCNSRWVSNFWVGVSR
jgi:hypothetical protein